MPVRKLTAELVREARRRYAAGETLKEIAADMPVGLDAVHCAITGRTWAHVKNPDPIPPHPTNNPNTVMTAAMVKEARRRAAAGESVNDMVSDYPVGESGLRQAILGYSWKHITDPPPVRLKKRCTMIASNRSAAAEKHVQATMPDDDATPCARCSLLTTNRYCRYCVAEGYAPAARRPGENPHPNRHYSQLFDPHMGGV